jgi:hypothetical protein
MIDDNEWLRASRLLEIFKKSDRLRNNGRDQLFNGLEAGRVRAMASDAYLKATSSAVPVPERDWLVEQQVWQRKSLIFLDLGPETYVSWPLKPYFEVRLTGLHFHRGDLSSYLDVSENPPRKITAIDLPVRLARPAPVASGIGQLPPNAKPADRRNEAFAHDAARLVRSGTPLADALRMVAPSDPARQPSSIEHGIRHTFGLMYLPDGRPIQP